MPGSVTSPHCRHCQPEKLSVELPVSISTVVTIRPRQRAQFTCPPLGAIEVGVPRPYLLHCGATLASKRRRLGNRSRWEEIRKREEIGQSAGLIRHGTAYHVPGCLHPTIIQEGPRRNGLTESCPSDTVATLPCLILHFPRFHFPCREVLCPGFQPKEVPHACWMQADAVRPDRRGTGFCLRSHRPRCRRDGPYVEALAAR